MSTLVLEVAGGAIVASPPLALIGLALILVPPSRQRILAVTSIGVLIISYAVAYVALSRGALEGIGPAGIPLGALAFIPAAAAVPIVALAPAVRRMIVGDEVRAGLIALQTYRVLGGGSFLLLLAVHRLPLLFAIPAGVGDILVGLSAWSAASASAVAGSGGEWPGTCWAFSTWGLQSPSGSPPRRPSTFRPTG